MFKFLKDKLNKAVSLFSKKVEEEQKQDISEPEKQELSKEADLEEDVLIKEPKDSAIAKKEQEENVEEPKVLEPISKYDYVVDEELLELQEEESVFEEVSADKVQEESFEEALEEKTQETLEEEKKSEQEELEIEKNEIELERQQAMERELAAKRRQEELEKAKLEQERKEQEIQEHKKLLEKKHREEQEKLKLEKENSEKLKKQKEEDKKRKLEEEKLKAEELKKKEEENKGGFFKKLFSKKEKPKPVEVPKPKLVLEKEEFDEVVEDYALPSESDDEIETRKEIKKEETELKQSKQEFINDKKVEEDKIIPKEEKGFFEKIKETLTTIKLSDEKFDEIFWDLELAMLENNVAVEVIEKIKSDLRTELTTGKVSRSSVDEIIASSLKKSVEELFIETKQVDLISEIKNKTNKPYIISFIGVNGAGKTTTMAKVAHLLMKNNLSVVFAASDTFRAAAMAQLQEHADKLGVKMIKHDYESDPAAVAFDAIKHAQAKNIDVVLIDTAGRLHTNDNLMNELKKLIRVNNPDMKIFIGESITGNDCVEQAKLFNEAVGIDAIILAKADIDEKGGAALSVSYVTKKPIIYLGTGQTYDDLEEFDSEKIIKSIGL